MRLLLPVFALLAACGQTGPLVLPEPAMPAPPTSEPVIVSPPQDEGDTDKTPADPAPATP